MYQELEYIREGRAADEFRRWAKEKGQASAWHWGKAWSAVAHGVPLVGLPYPPSPRARNFRDTPWVRVPVVHWEYSSTRVLTLEYLPGDD